MICVALLKSTWAEKAVERDGNILAGELRAAQRRNGSGSQRAAGECRRVHRALDGGRLNGGRRNHKRDRNGAGSREWPRVHGQRGLVSARRERSRNCVHANGSVVFSLRWRNSQPAAAVRVGRVTRSTAKGRRRNSGRVRNWLSSAPPACAVKLSDVSGTDSAGKYEASQSPTMVQSAGGVICWKRGMGSVAVAVWTVEIGPKRDVLGGGGGSPAAGGRQSPGTSETERFPGWRDWRPPLHKPLRPSRW